MEEGVSRSLYELFPTGASLFEKLGAHQTMIMDIVRCEAYRDAIREVVDRNCVVMDIGTGTGLLALFAADAGASRVYAVESSRMARLAAEVVERNGYGETVSVLNEHSADVTLPEKADLIVSETVGFWGIDENIVDVVRDARLRNGHARTLIIPSRITLYLAPVESPLAWSSVAYWTQPRFGHDFAPALRLARNNVYVRLTIDPAEILAKPEQVADIRLGGSSLGRLEASGEFRASRSGTVFGLAAWFTVTLTDTIRLSTAPGDPPLHWGQCFLPAQRPVMVTPGSRLPWTVAVEVDRRDSHFEWSVGGVDPGRVSLSSTRLLTSSAYGDTPGESLTEGGLDV